MRKRIEKLLNWCGVDDVASEMFSWFIIIGIIGFIIARISFGMYEANDTGKCKAETIGDVILSPAYAIGCNISKKRFDFKLN